VLVPAAALHTVRWLDDLESAVGKPVVIANQVTILEALRLARRPVRATGRSDGHGRDRSAVRGRAEGIIDDDMDTGSDKKKVPTIALAALWIPPVISIVLYVADHI
jgi:hypothetical protein